MRPIFVSASPGFKIAYLFLLLFIGMLVAGLLSWLIMLMSGSFQTDEAFTIYVSSALQSIFAIALPAYLVVALTDARPIRYLKMGNNGKMMQKVAFTLLTFCVSYLFASFLSQWNKGMVLPEWMSGLEETMRTMEDAAMETTDILLSGKTIGSLLLNLIVVAGLAAVSEEFFFRGALQQFLQEKMRNGHAAVWLAALIFSLVHFQFYGFLPRLALGAMLGYLYLYTRNLWMPVLFHFINNATVIVLYYFWSDQVWFNRLEEMPVTSAVTTGAALSALLTFLLFRAYMKRNTNAASMPASIKSN